MKKIKNSYNLYLESHAYGCRVAPPSGDWTYRFDYDEVQIYYNALCYSKLVEYYALKSSDKHITVHLHNYKVPSAHKLKRLCGCRVSIDGEWIEDIYHRFGRMLMESADSDGYTWMTVEVRS